MKLKTVALAATLAFTSSLALAQSPGGTAGGSSKAGGPAATQPSNAGGMKGSTIGRGGAHHSRHHARKHNM
jgi:hypothetical protein